MLQFNNPQYLISEQYRDAGNLNARIEIHRRFSTNHYGWMRWLFDIIAAAAGPRVLELGCGSASLWAANMARVPAAWQITLSDFSPGMVAAAQRGLGEIAGRFQFQVVDAQEIPFDDGSCDTVIANHMLYHVPDLNKALSEIHRVLRPGGRLYASTVGREHLAELAEWNRRFGLNAINNEDIAERFGLETGAARLAPWFAAVIRHVYEDALVVTEAEPLIAYVLSSMSADQAVAVADQLAAFARFVDNELAAHGSLHITKASGMFEAVKRNEGSVESVLTASEDISETEWLTAAARNPAFADLNEASEDIYSPTDGSPFDRGSREASSEAFQTMLASEAVLRRDWDRPEEDEAWANL